MSESEEQRVACGTRDSPFDGWIAADGKTLAYPCRYCGRIHRHTRRGEKLGQLCNRQAHCPPEGGDSVWFRLVAVVVAETPGAT